jgi:hypothetical protein
VPIPRSTDFIDHREDASPRFAQFSTQRASIPNPAPPLSLSFHSY